MTAKAKGQWTNIVLVLKKKKTVNLIIQYPIIPFLKNKGKKKIKR